MVFKQLSSFEDLELYQNLYKAMLIVHREIVPKLPQNEKYDLVDQLRRCSKSAPALVAEGFAKRYQPLHWKRYLIDTIGECNEMIHYISVCMDLYSQLVDTDKCRELKDIYDKCRRQATKLAASWQSYHNRTN